MIKQRGRDRKSEIERERGGDRGGREGGGEGYIEGERWIEREG